MAKGCSTGCGTVAGAGSRTASERYEGCCSASVPAVDSGRLVEDDNASAPLRPSRALAEIGTARGGSYAVPAITVCTPTTTA